MEPRLSLHKNLRWWLNLEPLDGTFEKMEVESVQETVKIATQSTDHSHCCVPECNSDARYNPENKVSFHTCPKRRKEC